MIKTKKIRRTIWDTQASMDRQVNDAVARHQALGYRLKEIKYPTPKLGERQYVLLVFEGNPESAIRDRRSERVTPDRPGASRSRQTPVRRPGSPIPIKPTQGPPRIAPPPPPSQPPQTPRKPVRRPGSPIKPSWETGVRSETHAPGVDAGISAPPGWYPDPSGVWFKRQWDGSRWTHNVGREDGWVVDPTSTIGMPPPSAGDREGGSAISGVPVPGLGLIASDSLPSGDAQRGQRRARRWLFRAAVPPSWRNDPTRFTQMRWWDGARWTEHASSRGTVIIDPIPGRMPKSPKGPIRIGRVMFASLGLCLLALAGLTSLGVQISSDDGPEKVGLGRPVDSGIEGLPVPSGVERDSEVGDENDHYYVVPSNIPYEDVVRWFGERLPEYSSYRSWRWCERVAISQSGTQWIWHRRPRDILSVYVTFDEPVTISIGKDQSGPC